MKRNIATNDSVQTVKQPKINLANLQQVRTVLKAGGTSGILSNNSIIQTIDSARAISVKSVHPVGTSSITEPRRAFIIKREAPQRTIYSLTVELIEKNPLIHLGVQPSRMNVMKNIICHTANVQLLDCYLTLKKLRQNEDFVLLAQYFELTEATAQQIFARTICRLARYMRYLIRWPDSKRYYERHKHMPFAFRGNLSNVQSIVECVETEMQRLAQLDCANYKFILSITPNGIISHISDAFVGHNDDLAIFKATNFQASIPKYLQIFAVPGKAIRCKQKSAAAAKAKDNFGHNTDSNTDSAEESTEDLDTFTIDENGLPVGTHHSLNSFTAARIAGELASQQTLHVEDNCLTSRKVKDVTLPTTRVRDPICRQQINSLLERLREYKVLQPYAIKEPMVFQYINEMLIVSAALTNLNR